MDKHPTIIQTIEVHQRPFYAVFILRALEANRFFMWSEATRYRCSYSVFGADKCGVAE